MAGVEKVRLPGDAAQARRRKALAEGWWSSIRASWPGCAGTPRRSARGAATFDCVSCILARVRRLRMAG